MGRRQERLSGQIAKEVSRILQREVKDSRVGFATISRVDLTDDLYHAKIYVSVMGDEAERKSTMIALERSTPFVRKELGRVLRIRSIPDIRFVLDLNLDHSFRIQEILATLRHEPDPSQIPPSSSERKPKSKEEEP